MSLKCWTLLWLVFACICLSKSLLNNIIIIVIMIGNMFTKGAWPSVDKYPLPTLDWYLISNPSTPWLTVKSTHHWHLSRQSHIIQLTLGQLSPNFWLNANQVLIRMSIKGIDTHSTMHAFSRHTLLFDDVCFLCLSVAVVFFLCYVTNNIVSKCTFLGHKVLRAVVGSKTSGFCKLK